MMHVRRNEFRVVSLRNGDREVTFVRNLDPLNVLIPAEVIRSEVAKETVRGGGVSFGTNDEREYNVAINLAAEMMRFVLDD